MTRAVTRDDDAVNALAALAVADPAALTPFLTRLLAANVSWRPVLYRGADDTVRQEIVARIEAGAGPRLHQLLQALAHAGGPIAESAFRRWTRQPPPDAELLHLRLEDYPPIGGWAFDADGVRRLCGQTALDLVPGETPVAPAARPSRGTAATDTAAEGRCPWCANHLWAALELDTAEPLVAEALDHTGWRGRLRVVTCASCACHGTLFCEVAADGTARWSARNREPEFLSRSRYRPPEVPLVPGGRRPGPFPAESVGPAGAEDGSSIGGFPGRLPMPGHPACPACGRVMAYVATIVTGGDAGGPEEFAEVWAGRRYTVFLDAGCGLAAVRLAESPEPVMPPTSAVSPGHLHDHGHGHGHDLPAGAGSAEPVLLPMPTVRPPSGDR